MDKLEGNRVGHIILMKDRDHMIFIKGVNISSTCGTTCLKFNELLSESKCLHLHFLNSLPQERAFVPCTPGSEGKEDGQI